MRERQTIRVVTWNESDEKVLHNVNKYLAALMSNLFFFLLERGGTGEREGG